MNFWKLLTITTYLFFSHNSFGQKTSILELENTLSDTSNDSIRIALIEKIQVAYRKKDLNKHKSYILKGLELSKKLKNKQKEGIFTREYGIYYKNKGTLDSSLFYYNAAAKSFISIKDSMNYYNTLSSIANIKKRQGNYDSAINHFLKSITFLESKKNKKTSLNAQILKMNLANVYLEINDTQKAIDIYNSILKKPISKTHKGLLKATYNNLSASFKNIKQLDSALYYAQKTELLLKNSEDYKSLGSLFTNIGSILEEQDEYNNAKNYFLKALNNYTKTNITSNIITAHNNLGNISTKLDDLKKAEHHLLKAQELLVGTKNNYSQVKNFEGLISLYSKSNRYKKAYNAQQLLIKLNDSILGIEKQKAIEDIQTKYEVDKKTLETENAKKAEKIALIEAEENKKYLWYSVIIGLLVITILGLYLFIYRNRKRQQLTLLKLNQAQKELDLEKQYHSSELKALKSQMNPHFLFNAMNSIQSLILKGNKEEAYTYLTKFASLIRENLNMSEKDFIPFDDEFQLLSTYLQLEKLRFKSDFEYTFEGENSIDDIKIPSMIIQPFIENAIKHGLLHKDGSKTLIINFNQTKSILICTITDNGIGREASLNINKAITHKPKSLATGFISKRFQLLKEYYNTDLGFEYIDLKENNTICGTQVIIKIPFTSYE
jgi:hypothetical protein